MDKVESRCSSSAPFPDSGLVVRMMKNWFTQEHHFVVSPCNLQVFRQHSTLYLCTSGVLTTRLQYGTELFSLGDLFLAHVAMAGCASLSLNVEMILRVIPPLKSNGWLVLLLHRLGWTWSSAVEPWSGCSTQRCSDMPQRTFWLNWSLSLHKLRESATPVNTIRFTWWLSNWWWWTLISYCIVLYFFNSTACKSELIIPVCLISTCSSTFNHIFIHLYINLYIITCQSSASSHIILSCNITSCQAEILPVEFRQHRRKVPVRDRLP